VVDDDAETTPVAPTPSQVPPAESPSPSLAPV